MGQVGPSLGENENSWRPALHPRSGAASAEPAKPRALLSLSLRPPRRRRPGARRLPLPHRHGCLRRRRPCRGRPALRRVLAALQQTAGRGGRPRPGESSALPPLRGSRLPVARQQPRQPSWPLCPSFPSSLAPALVHRLCPPFVPSARRCALPGDAARRVQGISAASRGHRPEQAVADTAL